MNPAVDPFFWNAGTWRAELEALREIALDGPLTEELKWGKPCYTFDGRNVAILQGFRDFCAVLFPKGALLPDPAGILRKPGPNTQAARRVPFRSVAEVDTRRPELRALLEEAIEAEKAGRQVAFADASEFPVPEEFQDQLDSNPALRSAFDALTPGRRKAWLLHFSAPKQSRTRIARVEKCIPAILEGKGPRDR